MDNKKVLIICKNGIFIDELLEKGIKKENIYALCFTKLGFMFAKKKIDIERIYMNDEDIPIKFDVIIGNPAYQKQNIGDGGGKNMPPIYHTIVEKCISHLKEDGKLLFIIPSRWMTGGMGLSKFRKKMMESKKVKEIRHFEDASKIFPEVEIKGGVQYFLYDNSYNGGCKLNGEEIDLNSLDIIIEDKISIEIINKLNKFKKINERVFPLNSFNLPTNFDNWSEIETGIKCYSWNSKEGRGLKSINEEDFSDKKNILNKWKVFGAKANQFFKTKNHNVFIAKPNEIMTHSYFSLGSFNTETEAINYSKYTQTKIFKFFLDLKVKTQDFSKEKFSFIPDMEDYTKEYNDEFLYKHFNLTEEEIEFIEKTIPS